MSSSSSELSWLSSDELEALLTTADLEEGSNEPQMTWYNNESLSVRIELTMTGKIHGRRSTLLAKPAM